MRQQLPMLLATLGAELCQGLGCRTLQEKLAHEIFSFLTYTNFPFSMNSDSLV